MNNEISPNLDLDFLDELIATDTKVLREQIASADSLANKPSELSQFEPQLAENGIFWTKEQWERKYSATEKSLAAAVSLGLDIYAEGDVKRESSQMAVAALGVNPFDKLMAQEEGQATAVVDEAARLVIAKESTLTLPQLYKIFAQYRQGLNLGDEHVQELLAKIEVEKLGGARLSTNEDMEMQLEIDGETLTITPASYVSILVADLFERARENRSIFDKNNNTPISVFASKIRSELHMGLLTQRSSEVLEKVKLEKMDSLPAEMLALLEMQHGVGFHGIGQEKIFIKKADGTVVEQTRMKECGECAHGAEETINNNAPDMPISEMVKEFEARQEIPEMPEMEREILPMYPLYAIPFGLFPPNRLQIMYPDSTTHPTVETYAKAGANTDSQVGANLKSQPAPKLKKSGLTPTTSITLLDHSPSKLIKSKSLTKSSPARVEGIAHASSPRVTNAEIVLSSPSREPVATLFRAPITVGSDRANSREPQVQRSNTPRMVIRHLDTLAGGNTGKPSTTDNPRNDGKPVLDLSSRPDAVAFKPPTREVEMTGSIVAAAFRSTVDVRQVRVGETKKAETKVGTEARKEVRVAATNKQQKVVVVDAKSNAVRDDGQASSVTPQLKQKKVIKTQPPAAKKRELLSSSMALHLALPSASHEINVLNRMSARQMIYAALPLAI